MKEFQLKFAFKVTDKLMEYNIYCLPFYLTNDVMNMLVSALWRHINV